MKLNKIQIEMLRQMLSWGEYTYSYWYLDDIIVDGHRVTKKELQLNMAELRKLGFVKMYRGGIDDDGQIVGGTHFGIFYLKRKEVIDIVEES